MKDVIQSIFKHLTEINRIDNGLTSINIIRCYCIAAKEDKYWPIKPEFFIDLIIENIGQFSKEEIEQMNIKRDIDLLRDYLPGLPPNEKLYN
ncbi:hypothetical protein [Reichenbachiella sp. MALMAid0571]|uniref:hypothetical protein n=1 Tax=Reichenbachiella sp. MALMAid0571 TaxID=3143939 RepID=UPI0032DEB0B4